MINISSHQTAHQGKIPDRPDSHKLNQKAHLSTSSRHYTPNAAPIWRTNNSARHIWK